MKFSFFAKHFPIQANHLDIACGAGTFLASLGQTDSSIRVGIDIAVNQLQVGIKNKKATNIHFVQSTGTQLPFPDNYFQVVTSIELVEHLTIDECNSLLTEIYRVLKPRGVLLLSSPNYRGLWPFVEWLINKLADTSYEEQHITKYNRHQLKHILINKGFADVRVRGFMFAAPFFAGLNWRLADLISRIEPSALVDKFGLLLFASGSKQ